MIYKYKHDTAERRREDYDFRESIEYEEQRNEQTSRQANANRKERRGEEREERKREERKRKERRRYIIEKKSNTHEIISLNRITSNKSNTERETPQNK